MARKITDRCVFVVESRNLGFSVLTFSAAFTVAIVIIILRRKLLNAELGGPPIPKWASFVCFISMWVGWVSAVSWRVMRYEQMMADFSEQLLMVASIGSVELLIAIVALATIV